MSAIHLEINFFLSSLTIPIFASRIKIQFWKEKIHFIQKNIENKLVSDNLKEIRKKGCSLLSQYYHVIPVHIDIPITQHALMLPDQGQRGCKVTHPSTHLDKNQNTHLNKLFSLNHTLPKYIFAILF